MLTPWVSWGILWAPGGPSSPPVILAPEAVTAYRGEELTFSIIATQGPESYAIEGLPAGLTLDEETGEVTGTPLEAGRYDLILSATNELGTTTATAVLSVLVRSPESATRYAALYY